MVDDDDNGMVRVASLARGFGALQTIQVLVFVLVVLVTNAPGLHETGICVTSARVNETEFRTTKVKVPNDFHSSFSSLHSLLS